MTQPKMLDLSDAKSCCGAGTDLGDDDIFLFDSVPEKMQLLDGPHPLSSMVPHLAQAWGFRCGREEGDATCTPLPLSRHHSLRNMPNGRRQTVRILHSNASIRHQRFPPTRPCWIIVRQTPALLETLSDARITVFSPLSTALVSGPSP